MFDPQEEARKELAKRELARRRLLPFVERFQPDYTAGWVHKDICKRLEQFSQDVADQLSPRLMIFVPPRHGKSQISSKSYPAWHLGHYPNHEFMLCSYSGALSMSFSRVVRSVMRDPAYHNVFDTQLDPDSQSVEAWLTTKGGGLVAAGVGGAITGKGAHVLLIDDPVKNREDADSEVSRQSTWDWYTSTAYTRLAPGGGVLVIQTRWHDDDLSGRLIEAQKAGADQWEIVDYPAVAEHDEPYRKRGEALHPERYDITRLTAIRKAIGERDWFALYQQKPISDEGSYFTKDMFPRYRPHERPPLQDLTIVASWDFAIGQKEVNDWTVCVVAGMDKDMRLWVLDCVRGKWDGYSIVQQIIAVQQRWKPERHGMEKGQILMSIEVFLRKEIETRQMYDLYYEPIAPGKNDKQARARGIQGLMKSGQVLFPDDDTTPWITQLVFECLRFPAGLHDDVVDALAYVGYLYRNMTPQPEPTTPKKPSWKDKLNQYVTYDSTRRRWQQA
jgi:predicted phage terminase large subunit-like protein